MKAGQRIAWQYTHATNRRTRFERVKHGTFIRMIKNPNWIRIANKSGMGFPLWCYVQFDGNKNPSRVMLREIKKIDNEA